VLESCLASLDGAKYCVTFASGLAACTTITHLLSAGDHIVSMDVRLTEMEITKNKNP
jgi:cystathionine gamma-lyase